jgi:hypothetical protein
MIAKTGDEDVSRFSDLEGKRIGDIRKVKKERRSLGVHRGD